MSVNDAILALIKAAVPAVTVFDSGAPDEDQSVEVPDRYAVYWPDMGTPEKGQVSDRSTGRRYRWQVDAVAPDRGMAEWIAATIAAALEDQIPSIGGYQTGPIDHTFSLPAERDEQILSRRVVVARDRYELLTEQR